VEIIPSPLPPTSYNWSFFILDAAFYAAIGYGIVLFYAWFVWKQQDHFNFASVSKQRIHPYLKKIGVPY